jgi:hypothetical protein
MTHVSVIPAFLASPNSNNALEWSLSPDLESEITTLAAWCRIKQQQRVPLSSLVGDSDGDLDELTDDEECTNLPNPPFMNGDAAVKKDFLDRLAELLCYRKDPSLITGTALIYSEVEVTILAARNSTASGKSWSDRDVKMLEYLAGILERISADGKCLHHKLACHFDRN